MYGSSVLDIGIRQKWWVSRCGSFISEERAFGIHWIISTACPKNVYTIVIYISSVYTSFWDNLYNIPQKYGREGGGGGLVLEQGEHWGMQRLSCLGILQDSTNAYLSVFFKLGYRVYFVRCPLSPCYRRNKQLKAKIITALLDRLASG